MIVKWIWVFAVAVFIFACAFQMVSEQYENRRKAELAYQQSLVIEEEKKQTEEAIVSQQKFQEEVRENAKEMQKQLESITYIDNGGYIDDLLRLLDEDSANRHKAGSGLAAEEPDGIMPRTQK